MLNKIGHLLDPIRDTNIKVKVMVLHTEPHDENLFRQHIVRTKILVFDTGNNAGVL